MPHARAPAADQLRLVARPREEPSATGTCAITSLHSLGVVRAARPSRPCRSRSPAARRGTRRTRGTLKFAISPRAHSMISAGVDRRTRRRARRTPSPTSPSRSSGTPITAACAIARVAQQQVLDLGRVRVEAADDEHVLDPADDAQVAVGVEGAEVAGVQPAVGVDRGRGRLRVVEVAAHHGVAAHEDLARLARRGVGARLGRRCAPRSRATATPTVVAMCSKSSSGLLPVTVPASVSP